jgi:4-cresol dehydrogenase (hydroxylating)
MRTEILEQLRTLLGEAGTFESLPESIRAAADDSNTQIVAAARPGTVEELRDVLQLARTGGFAVWVLPNEAANGGLMNSTAKPVLVIDQSRMNRIVEVNTKAAYALVEPGVSFAQLSQHLEDNNTGLWVDSDRNRLNSVSGSIASHEFGYTAYGDHLMMQCGMEVMLGDGSLIRLGMGAMPKSNTWQLFKYGYGPYLDGLFTQSNLGVITKIGVWLMPAPPGYQPFMVSLGDDAGLAAVIDTLRPLKVDLIIPNTVVISNATLDASPYARRTDYVDGDAVTMDKVRSDFGLGKWNLYAALYNTPPNVELLWSLVKAAMEAIPGATVHSAESRGSDPVWTNREAVMRGALSDRLHDVNHWSGARRLELAYALPIKGERVVEVNDKVGTILAQHGFDHLSECAVGWRSCLYRICLLHERADRERAIRCSDAITESLAAIGIGAVNADPARLESAVQSYGDSGLSELRRRLKRALDPEGVFA